MRFYACVCFLVFGAVAIQAIASRSSAPHNRSLMVLETRVTTVTSSAGKWLGDGKDYKSEESWQVAESQNPVTSERSSPSHLKTSGVTPGSWLGFDGGTLLPKPNLMYSAPPISPLEACWRSGEAKYVIEFIDACFKEWEPMRDPNDEEQSLKYQRCFCSNHHLEVAVAKDLGTMHECVQKSGDPELNRDNCFHCLIEVPYNFCSTDRPSLYLFLKEFLGFTKEAPNNKVANIFEGPITSVTSLEKSFTSLPGMNIPRTDGSERPGKTPTPSTPQPSSKAPATTATAPPSDEIPPSSARQPPSGAHTTTKPSTSPNTSDSKPSSTTTPTSSTTPPSPAHSPTPTDASLPLPLPLLSQLPPSWPYTKYAPARRPNTTTTWSLTTAIGQPGPLVLAPLLWYPRPLGTRNSFLADWTRRLEPRTATTSAGLVGTNPTANPRPSTWDSRVGPTVSQVPFPTGEGGLTGRPAEEAGG